MDAETLRRLRDELDAHDRDGVLSIQLPVEFVRDLYRELVMRHTRPTRTKED